MGAPEETASSSSSSSSSNVRVVTRIRPLSRQEQGSAASLSCLPGKQPLIQVSGGVDSKENKRWFEFDAVLDESATQEEVYLRSGAAQAVTVDLFKGYNTTILAYGQTGSGKTYTMGTANCTGGTDQDPQQAGIIPRACADLFATIQSKCDGQAVVTLSYLELYNEQIRDLLQTNNNDPPNGGKAATPPLRIRETLQGEVYVSGVVTHKVTSPQEIGDLMEQAGKQRVVASTAMNAVSSRSHAICTLHIEGLVDDNVKFSSKLTLVDLAGSERIKRTGAVGARQAEGININKSLLVLGQVVSALSEKKKPPYRDSKLTRLLQDSLGGNSRTLLLACASPAACNLEESINTLRYASRARKIQNTATRNLVENISPEEAAALKRENQLLKQQVAELQQTIRTLTSVDAHQPHQHSPSISPTNTVSTFVSDDYPSDDEEDEEEPQSGGGDDETDDNSKGESCEQNTNNHAPQDESSEEEKEENSRSGHSISVLPLELNKDVAEFIIQISNLKVEVAQLKGELDQSKFVAQRYADLKVQLAEVKAEADSARIAASYLSDIVDDLRSLKKDEMDRMHQLLQMKLKEQNMFSLVQAMLGSYRMQVARLSTDFEKNVVRSINNMGLADAATRSNPSDSEYDNSDDNVSVGSIGSRSAVSRGSMADLRSMGSFLDTTRPVGSFLYGRMGPKNRSWWKSGAKETTANEPILPWKEATTTFQSKIREIEASIGSEVESLNANMSRLVEETVILESEIGNREVQYRSLLRTRDDDRKNQLVDHLSSMLVVKQASS
mmetsp:Transcript_1743/g.3817  ORF Transcript_1743/g.3817 Transcript_1743/m.3817 type:complete len:784 (+) Transcript_1743:100-2451(+)|eukprot:scaffold1498_cov163-Amphora_coffeaeformis.AAC.2